MWGCTDVGMRMLGRAFGRGLSKMLDGTLSEGAHDMRVFGLGFLRSVATYDDYGCRLSLRER